MRRFLIVTVTVVLSTAGSLVLAELLARSLGVATLGFTDPIYRRSEARDVVYELKPHARGWAWGRTWVETNALGLRGPEVATPKPAGTWRLGVFGDSVTFGQGVREEDTYVRVLERLLRSRFGGPEQSFEVLNFGVPSYNISNIVASFVAKGVPLELDAAVLAPILEDYGFHRQHSVDDAGYPNHATSPMMPSSLKNALRRLHLAYLVRDAWWSLRGANTAEVAVLFDERDDSLARATWERAEREIRRFLDVAREHDITPFYLALDMGRSARLETVLARTAVERIEVRAAVESQPPELMRVSARDGHPSALHHRILAEVLFEALARRFGSEWRRSSPANGRHAGTS